MKISVCLNCGKTSVITDHSAACCFCCSAKGFDTICDVLAPYYETRSGLSDLESKLEARRFDEVIEGLDDIIAKGGEPMSGAFWLRLLATHQCTGESQLLCKGFDYHTDPDYLNAVRFSEGPEHSAYVFTAGVLDSVKTKLIRFVTEYNNSARAEAGTLSERDKLRREIARSQSALTELLKQLAEIELQMRAREMAFTLAAEPYHAILRQAKKSTETRIQELANVERCTQSGIQGCQIKNRSLETMSDNALAELKKLRAEHPSVKAFESLLISRDEKYAEIKRELSSLQIARRRASSFLDELISIDRKHRDIIRSVEKYDFTPAEATFPSNLIPDLIAEASAADAGPDVISPSVEPDVISPSVEPDVISPSVEPDVISPSVEPDKADISAPESNKRSGPFISLKKEDSKKLN